MSVLFDNMAESTLLGGGKIKKKKIEARGQAESTLLAGGKIRGGGNRSWRTERSRICSCVHHETNSDPQIYLVVTIDSVTKFSTAVHYPYTAVLNIWLRGNHGH
jgi:hypothetical protein